MIEGSVDSEGVPSVQLEIDGRSWRAIIDTGFNGDLELPEDLKSFLHAKFIGRVRSLLAGGRVVDEDSFRVQSPFDGMSIVSHATFVHQREILIGTHLLRQHCLDIDFVARTVRIERRGTSGAGIISEFLK